MTPVCYALVLAVASAAFGAKAQSGDPRSMVDHLVYAAPDLDQAIDRIERLIGVRASVGGSHPGRGTRNALVALGPTTYLEIIGPDPAQPAPDGPRVFGIDGLREPRIATWASARTDLATAAGQARARGVALGNVIAGSRRRIDGVLLTWQYTDPRVVVGDGLVPFLIDWGRSPHPAASAAPGVTLIGLRGEHPEPQRIRQLLDAAGVPMAVSPGAVPALAALLDTPRGRVELR